MANIYLLQSQDGRHQYLGCTTDTETRLSAHNQGLTRSTQYKGPWILIKTWECETMKEAREIEYHIKRMKRRLTVDHINFVIAQHRGKRIG